MVKNWRVWLLGIVALLVMVGARGMSFWLPVVLTGVTHQHIGQVGLIAMVPSLAGIIGLYINATHSDRRKERQQHVIIPHYLAAFALLSAGIVVLANQNLSIACLVIAEGCMMAAGGVFWTLPTLILGSQTLGIGLGVIGSIGCIGGIVGPLFMGVIMSSKDGVHGISLLMGFVGLTQLLAGVIVASLRLEARERSTTVSVPFAQGQEI
ncbi:MFS transporter [Ktedonospora formicarum]|uniref:Major facilitator superfamily (MFS) profile domain-containing protein n=1 Tax=Ktedonospora formicarum TaxID=2778364 RepID=A0A8J3HZZ5_9CHLR|nr:MFS transporter [Ktedonospora formicarum]GHO42369.1 hypothetical protein KSX_05320 [Ktedonospora formicarum]